MVGLRTMGTAANSWPRYPGNEVQGDPDNYQLSNRLSTNRSRAQQEHSDELRFEAIKRLLLWQSGSVIGDAAAV